MSDSLIHRNTRYVVISRTDHKVIFRAASNSFSSYRTSYECTPAQWDAGTPFG